MSKVAFNFGDIIEITKRTKFGSSATKEYKKQGFVMISIYNAGQSIHGLLDEKIAKKMADYPSIKTKILTFSIDGKKHKTMVKQFTIHAVSDEVDYIEFISCEGQKTVEVLVPISISGKAVCPGLKKSGKINVIVYEVPVIADINKIPEEINIDISKFGLGKTFRSTEINIDGIKPKSDFPILSIIGRGKKDAEEEAQEAAAAAAAAPAAGAAAAGAKQPTAATKAAPAKPAK